MAAARVPRKGPSKAPARNECGDHHGVHRQASRTGHEGCDQDGGNPVTLALDGASRHDCRNRTGVGGQQRDETLAVQSHTRHGAVGDDGRTRQVAGILKNSDHQEQQQNLREEDQHRAGSLPDAVDHQ